MISRRNFLGKSLAAGTLIQLPGLSFAVAPAAGAPDDPRLVVAILRGALDGLSAVVPFSDPDYYAVRPEIAIPRPGADGGALPLDTQFGLHPSLSFLQQRFAARELILFHAVATPYRDRSHFDAQNLLENGTPKPFGADSGWLNRALAGMAANKYAVALGQNVPLLLRGSRQVTSWAPSIAREVEPDLLVRLTQLYAGDTQLAQRLSEAVNIDGMAGRDATGMDSANRARGNQQRLTLSAETAGHFLSDPKGPRIAVLEFTGWDTHAQEGAGQGQLANRLKALDDTLAVLASSLGEAWAHTAVLVVTEFGRTVAQNGSRGTDHGTGTCAFLVGGAVAGGRVVADWPGLAERSLYEKRDLRPTLDLRSVCKGVLQDHLHVAQRHVNEVVFPASEKANALQGLTKA